MLNDPDNIYKEYAEMVFKFLMSLCHDVDIAQELTQETFYQAIKSANRYDGSCKVSTWLCQIARHMWGHYLDKKRLQNYVELDECFPSDEPGPEAIAERKDEKLQLYKMVHDLGDVEKEVVFLHLTGEFTFREIGEIFGKSENWARVTFYRAKQKLKER